MCECSVAQSCLTLCDPMDFSPPGSSVHGIIPASILEWFATSSSRGSSWPRDQTCISCVSCTGKWATGEVRNHGRGPWYIADPCFSECGCWTTSMIFTWKFARNANSGVSHSVASWHFTSLWTVALPGSSVRAILQARMLESVPILFSRRPRDQTWISHTAGRFFTTWTTREDGKVQIQGPHSKPTESVLGEAQVNPKDTNVWKPLK